MEDVRVPTVEDVRSRSQMPLPTASSLPLSPSSQPRRWKPREKREEEEEKEEDWAAGCWSCLLLAPQLTPPRVATPLWRLRGKERGEEEKEEEEEEEEDMVEEVSFFLMSLCSLLTRLTPRCLRRGFCLSLGVFVCRGACDKQEGTPGSLCVITENCTTAHW